MKNDHKDFSPAFRASESYVFDWAEQEELNYIMNHPETNKPEAFSKRLAAGHRCFYARDDNVVAAINWVSFESGCVLFGREGELTFFPLGENSGFTYDLHTYSEYRRQGIASKLKTHQFQCFGEMGISTSYAFILLSNITPLRLHLKLGATAERLIYCYKIGKWQRAFLGSNGEAKLLKKWLECMKIEKSQDAQDMYIKR